MFRTTLRNLWAHKLRLLTTGLAIVIGVAFISGTMVLTATIRQTMDTLFANAYEGTDALVRSATSLETPEGYELHGRIDEGLLDVVADVEGVAVVQGDVWGYAQVVGRDGQPVGSPGMGPPTVGASWPVDELNTWTLDRGRPPVAPDEVVLDKASAEKAGYGVGDRATVLVAGAPVEVTVAGISTFAGADSPAGASFVLFPFETAQRLIGESGKIDSVSIAAEPGVGQRELVERISAVLPAGIEVITGDAYVEENQNAMREALSFFDQFMMAFAIIALLVGGFMIFNTFFITVAQRTRQHALLRALGASRRQVLVSILAEALAIGVIASTVGLGAGVLVAMGLKALLAAFGFALPAGGVVFGIDTAVIAFTAGVVVTVGAAVSPARKAGKVPPIAALRDVAMSSSGYGSKERVLVGLLVLAVGVGGLLFGLLGDPDQALAFVGVGAVLVFFGVSILGRTVALPMSRAIGWILPKVRGVSGELARENSMRNPKRTAATAAALMIGVGLVSFITIFAASTKASFGQLVDDSFRGDLVVMGPSQFGGAGLAPELADRLAHLPEVDKAASVRTAAVEIDNRVEQVLATDQTMFELFDVDPVAGSPADLDASSIAVLQDVAEDAGIGVGDTVTAEFLATGETEFTVALVYGANQQIEGGHWMLSLDAFEANVPDQVDVQILVQKASDVAMTDARAAIERETAAYPGAQVLDKDEYKDEQLAFVDQLLGLVYALLALAILIAMMGIGNTLALSILERTRELGLLRAVGMTRRQLRSTIRWESVIIALQGAVLGLAIGLFFGWALVTAMSGQGLSMLSIPLANLAVVVVLAALAGVAAAILPARHASRMDALASITSE